MSHTGKQTEAISDRHLRQESTRPYLQEFIEVIRLYVIELTEPYLGHI